MELLYDTFAELLDYPSAALREHAAIAATALADEPAAAEELWHFQRYIVETAPGEVEERYTALFDLPAACPPYAGHQLLGEDWRRNLLLARLTRRYRERGFSAGHELPDHVSVLFRYLAREAGGPVEDELLQECVLPCLERMAARVGEGDRGYGALLRALCLWLRPRLAVGELQREAG